VAITKHIRRAHAYTGLTFSTAGSFRRGRQNVILSGGRVSESNPYAAAGVIDVDPFIAEVDGLVIHSDAVEQVSYSQPSTPGDRLFLVLSVPDDSDASGVTWTVLTRGADYTAGLVFAARMELGGSTTGVVWVQPPTSSLRSIIARLERPLQHRSEQAVEAGRFRVEVDNTLTNTPIVVRGPSTGIVAAALGAYLDFDADGGGFVLPPPHRAYPRRDRLVLRRGGSGAGPGPRADWAMFGGNTPDGGIDAEPGLDRHMSLEVVPGVPRRTDLTSLTTAFDQLAVAAAGVAALGGGMLAAAVQANLTPVGGPGAVRDGSFTQVTGYNSLYIAYQRVAGTDTLRFVTVAPDRTTVATFTGTTVDASRTHLDIVPLPDGGAVILYVSTAGATAWTKLWMSRVDSAGVFTQQGVLVLDASTGTGIVPTIVASAGILHPKGYLDEDGNIQIVMEVQLDPGVGVPALGTAEALVWTKMDADGVLLSQPVRLTDPGDWLRQPVVRDASVQYRNGITYITALRTPDLTAPAPDAVYLSFAQPSSVQQVVASDATTTAQLDLQGRGLVPGSYSSGTVGSAAVVLDPSGRAPAALFSGQDGGAGPQRRYAFYGPPSQPTLEGFEKRSDTNDVYSIELAHHSDQLGGGTPAASEGSEQLVAVHDGSAIHLVSWDAVNSQLVYERAAPHSLNDRPIAGDLTTQYILQNLAGGGGGDATIPDDVVIVRAASGEPLIVRIPAAAADAGAVVLTEVFGIEGEPDPLHPDVTPLAEFDVPAWDGSSLLTDLSPTVLPVATVSEPARELVVGAGAPGGLVGVAGLQLALDTLRGRGGTIRVRAGFYDLFQPLQMTSGIEVRCDPGAIFRARSPAAAGFIAAAGTGSFINAPDAAGVTSLVSLPNHPRTYGFTEGCLLRAAITGDEYYITEILEESGKIRVDDPAMPANNYMIMQTGIQWSGGTFIGEFEDAINFSWVAHSAVSGCHFKLVTSGASAYLLMLSGCTDLVFSDLYGALGANGQMTRDVYPAGVLPNKRVSLRNCRFAGGASIGTLLSWEDMSLGDLLFSDNPGALVLSGTTSGQVDRIRGNLQMSLFVSCSGRVVVGDTDFATQSDFNRTPPFNDTPNKPSWTDGWFRGNLYVSGFLNHGQYDLAILTLAMLVLDEQMFQLFGMVDGITEDFGTFEDVESASTYGRWYPDVAPLVLGGPAAILPDPMIGLSDRVAPDYVLDGMTSAVEMAEYGNPASGALHGRHAAIRGVLHHDAHPGAAPFGQDGFPDRGKMEFQFSWDSAGETKHLIGECGHRVDDGPVVPPYTVIQSNVGGSGSDGDELSFSAVRYDRVTPIAVGRMDPAVPGKWQRVYDTYTDLAQNRIVVVSSRVYDQGPGIWDLRVRVDLFEASTGDHVGGATLINDWGGPLPTPCTAYAVDPLNWTYGEFAEMKLVPDLTDPTHLWLFIVGRMSVGLTFNSQAAIRVAHVDMTPILPVTSGTLFTDLTAGAPPAGTKFQNLDSTDVAVDPDIYWRGLSVVPVADNFAASTTDANNYIVSCMKTTTVITANGQADWDLEIGIFNCTDEAFSAPGGMVHPAGATIANVFIPCAMSNALDRAGLPIMLLHSVVGSMWSDGAAWPWEPLSGGSYVSAGDERAVFVVATAASKNTWVAATLTAIRVSWTAAAWTAPNAANVQGAPAGINLSHFPGAIWDSISQRFLMAYAAGNAFGAGHTSDEVFTQRVRWAGGPWAWDGAGTSRRAAGSPRLQNLVSASLADQDDAAASQRLNISWQSEPGGSAGVWGGVQIETGNAITIGNWYDGDLPELTLAWPWQLSTARYWMSQGEWTPGAQFSVPASTDTLLREHFMLYHRDSGTILQGVVYLRCVAPQLAVKVEVDLPWADNLEAMQLRFLGAGQTNGVGAAAVPGYEAYAQTGFRTSSALAAPGAAPTNDRYDGAAGSIVAANVDPYLAARDWLTSGTVRGAAGNIPNVAGANVAQRDVLAITLASNDEKWTNGSRVIALETAAGYIGGSAERDLLGLMVGQVVTINDGGVGGPSDHRVTYFGNDPAGMFSMIIEPPIGYAAAGPFANNTLTFKKRVTGAVMIPLDGESTLIHPERLWLNLLDLEAERLPVLIGSSVDTTPVIPPGSAVVLLSLIDTDGTLTAAMAAGVALSSYLTVEITRDYPTAGAWQTVNFGTVGVGNPSPLYSAPMGDGSTLHIVHALHAWPIAPVVENDVSYRVTWVDGAFPGKGLHVDKVVLGWN